MSWQLAKGFNMSKMEVEKEGKFFVTRKENRFLIIKKNFTY